MMGNYKKLIVFQKADDLALAIYRITNNFPASEKYGLTSQIRRAALSVPTNIVEGYTRKSRKELSQFLNIAYGSLAETEYLFNFSKRLGYHANINCQVDKLLEEVSKLIWSFRSSI